MIFPKIFKKDRIDEWTALLTIIVENYPSLCATIVQIQKCVLTTINNRAHSNPQELAICSAHSKTNKNCGTQGPYDISQRSYCFGFKINSRNKKSQIGLNNLDSH
jgi:hypothetical protein